MDPIQVQGLNHWFGTGEARKQALFDVSLTVARGSLTILMGPSGSGKTTLLTLMGCLREVQDGSVRLLGTELKGADTATQEAMRRRLGFIFQAHNLHESLTARQNVLMGLQVHGRGDPARQDVAVAHLLTLLGLGDRIDYLPANLSGGQKQRVAIARALAVEPSVMLLDEPLSALDLKLRQHMRAELRAIQKRTGVTFIYITHDQGEALAMSDRVGVMSHGRLQQVAPPRDIYDNPVNGFVASFVGENNIIAGSLTAKADGMAGFDTALGPMRARLRPDTGGEVKLFVRPEHMRLSDAAAAENSVPVTVTEVAFEGNFISVHGRSATGQALAAELRNDGFTAIPSVGAQLHMSFDAARAAILPDESGAAGSAAAVEEV